MTLIVSLAFCGSVLAQETHWPGFDYHNFKYHNQVIARVQIDGELITGNDDYESFEVCPFVGNQQRGYNGFMVFDPDFGDLYPIVDLAVYFDNSEESVSFMLYDHSGTGTLYEYCEPSETVVTGQDFGQYDDMGTPIVLNFRTVQTFEKVIYGYGTATTGNYYLIASPVINDVTPTADNGFLTNAYDLYRFNQTAELEWENWKDENFQNNYHFDLVNGKGYLYANSGNVNNNPNTVTLTFEGVSYLGDGVIDLDYESGNNFTGWNLIGNPFATEAILDQPFYKMNGEGTALTAKIEDLTTTIDAMEGVFVEATEEGQSVTFTPQLPAKNGEQQVIAKTNILVIGNEGKVMDNAIVRFDGGATLGKFQLNANSTKVYIPQDGKDYAIVSAGEMGEIPVSFKAENNGSYTLSFTNEEVTFSYLHLIDNMTGNDVDLLETSTYSFNAQTTDYASRFKLVFVTGNSAEDNFAFNSNGNWIISNEGEATLQVIDVTGRILSSETINGSCSKAINAASGVYMLRLINGNDVKVQKMVVR